MTPEAKILALYREQGADAFEWGRRDCLTWCADCARALTGDDPAQGLRSRYESAAGARRVMRSEGWESMADVARSLLPEIPLARASTGDWAYLPEGDTLGVVVKHMIVSWTEHHGLGQVPLTRAQTAFRVG